MTKREKSEVESQVEEDSIPVSSEVNATYDETGSESEVEEISQEEKQIMELKKEVEETEQKWLRVQADFDNFRRRTRQEKEDFHKYASSKLIEKLLPVIDNFGRALHTSKDNKDFEALVKGIDMIFHQLDQVLEEEGLKPLEVVGEPFNPDFHQAIMQVESEEHEEGIVVEEIQKGYILKDKVLRPAMVKVSS